MALKRNPYLMIPIFFNMILAAGLPRFGGMDEMTRLAPVILLAFALPWFLYFLIGRILADVQKKAHRDSDGPEDSDFV